MEPKHKVRRVDIKLTEENIHEISSGKKLSDRHIDAANHLLKKQFPHVRGLQTPLFGQTGHFRVTAAPFIQMLHVRGDHWLTVVAADQKTVKVYDSTYRTLSKCTTMQVASIMHTTEDNITFLIANTTLQDGGTDCGLYAIAYATDYCLGKDPDCYR